jgi:FkbM family methyltransferase
MSIVKDVKAAAKSALQHAAVRLPAGGRAALFEALWDLEPHDHRRLVREAMNCNIAGFLIDGEWGKFQSSTNDLMILPIYAATGTWAKRTNVELIEFFAGRSGTYLDIGANIGLTTVPIARNKAVRCIAFEPDPTNFANLEENIRRNVPDANVHLRQIALFDRDATLTFGLSDDGNFGDHRIVDGAATSRKTIEVQGTTLDSFMEELTPPLAVKIDVQGAESKVIAGGKKTLAKTGFLVIEFSPFHIAMLDGDKEPIIDCLRSFEDIAITPGESDAELVYEDAKTACDRLERFFDEAKLEENAFKDIYARR